MGVRRGVLALVPGVAVLLVVGVIVTEAASTAVEFSLFVGVPTGLVAGAAVTVFVYGRLDDRAEPGGRRVALAIVAFGTVLLAVFVILAAGLGIRNSVALPAAAAVGLAQALVTVRLLRLSRGDDRRPA